MAGSIDLYGSANADIESLVQMLQDAFSVAAMPHESSYLGAYYLLESAGYKVKLLKNFVPGEGYTYKRWEEWPTILSVESTDPRRFLGPDLVAQLPGFVHLEHKTW